MFSRAKRVIRIWRWDFAALLEEDLPSSIERQLPFSVEMPQAVC